MRLETALYTGASGIQSFGGAISVVGDNISNSNTTAYKESRAEFAELLPKAKDGGNNGGDQESGSGVQISNVREIFANGVLEGTGRSLDAGIDGNGFFLVGDVADPLLTRAGNFSVDEAGNLVNSTGLPILGKARGANDLSAINLYNLNLTATPTSAATLTGNLDASSEIKTIPETPASFNEINQNASFFQAVEVFDSLGTQRTLSVAFYKTASGAFTAQAYIDGADVGGTAGIPVKVGAPLNLAFGDNGKLTNAAGSAVITATPAFNNGAAAGNFTIDLSGFTQYSAPSAVSNITKDGQATGNVKGYAIQKNGEILAQLDNGSSVLVGTLQLAKYPNTDGLERLGSGLYRAQADAGTRTVGNPGEDSLGTIGGFSLERSTVDLPTQFTNMIVLQRGYQANAQVMSKTSELWQQTIQLIR